MLGHNLKKSQDKKKLCCCRDTQETVEIVHLVSSQIHSNTSMLLSDFSWVNKVQER